MVRESWSAEVYVRRSGRGVGGGVFVSGGSNGRDSGGDGVAWW